ncbi:LOW QUALITY PROTEIN: cytosolic sulfotransferase 5-like [Prosopis cineraria]|uniref:LOW QUALITY PROTEIN: cytosolic sulfotransferase 5-like n=1 Tax=Prosopis cineraria TaxID=364024 RepID=UPI0024101C48|nr:LOW QUALITY PROTEIN: cytosolic sulfotransferase 5-like [Prosopis cineraria]
MSQEQSKASGLPVVPPKFWDGDDEALSQECRDLIATLPAEPYSKIHHLYQFQSFWHNKRVIQGVLNLQKHFQAHDSDIILVTMPKSGTTWLKLSLTLYLIAKPIIPLNPDPIVTAPHPLLTTNSHDLVPFLELHLYLENNPDLSSFLSPRLFATHLPYFPLPESIKSSRCKIVYLCRNPKDVLVSYWHFTSEFRPDSHVSNVVDADLFEKFCQGKNPYGPFWDQILGYYQESLKRPEKIMFLRFEELKSEPVRVLKELAEFLGFGFSKEEENGDAVGDILRLCSFGNLSNLEVNKSGKSSTGMTCKNYFRRGEVGDSKNFLTPDMIKRLDDITEEKLGIHGLKF